ncbi:MAG: hypothetical protein ABJC26_09270 [Gemmatimonadaceae bacterium]
MITLGTLALICSVTAIQPAADTTTADTLNRAAVTTAVVQDSIENDTGLNMAGVQAPQDTLVRRRKAVVYSDAYGTRATIHRRLSYAMVPLFAISYFTGDQLFKNGSNSSSFVINAHRASATAVSVLFAVNAVTGGINLWQGRHDPIDRKRKLLHSALFIASSAGFSYAGAVLANQAETSLAKRNQHKQLNLISMGLSIGSVVVMMVPHD